MRPLFQLKTIDGLSLKEAGDIVEAAARMGCGGLVLPRGGDWELIRGFCRAAGKHGLRLWLRDDPDRPSGSYGGEIASVPSYRSQSPEFWGCGLYNADAAEAFLDSSYVSMRRELRSFLGYELAGAVTSFALGGEASDPEGFAAVQLRPLSEFCREHGLELVAEAGADAPYAEKYADTKTAFADITGLSMAERQRRLLDMAASGKRRLAAVYEPYPDFMEEVWSSWANSLFSMAEAGPEPVPAGLPEGLKAVRFGDSTLIYNTSSGPVTAGLTPDAFSFGYIAGPEGGLYLPVRADLTFTLYEGGFLTLVSAGERAAEPLPPILSSGAVFGTVETAAALVPELAGIDENRLPLALSDGRAKLDARHIPEGAGIRVEAEKASYIRLNGRELAGSNTSGPAGPIIIGGGDLRLGPNIFETDGTGLTLYGNFSADEGCLLPPIEPGPGNVREQGLARYDGPLCYRAVLPEAVLPEDCGGKYLTVEGSFGCALVKIARRRHRLLLAPFAVPLFAADGGKTAEIIIFPANDQKSIAFGINSVNIVNVKN